MRWIGRIAGMALMAAGGLLVFLMFGAQSQGAISGLRGGSRIQYASEFGFDFITLALGCAGLVAIWFGVLVFLDKAD